MKSKPPAETYLLIILMTCLSFAAIFGGISLIIDPSGNRLQINIEEYRATYIFSDFLFPGVILVLLFGILPLLLAYPLLKKPMISWAGAFNIYLKRHWAWTYALYIGFLLIVWTNIQIYMMGYNSGLQILTSLYGLAIIFVCLLPEQINYFSKWKLKSNEQKIGED